LFSSRILAILVFALLASTASLSAQTPAEVTPAPAPADTIDVDWWFKANQYEASEGTKVAVICPAAPNSIDQRVWGTVGAQDSYTASNRNAVASAEYGAWSRSFRFIVPEAEVIVPEAEEEDTATP
jgi:hypothetical protein